MDRSNNLDINTTASEIPTRFLIISDNHGDDLIQEPTEQVDVAIHCGDLTEESKLAEFRKSIEMLKRIKAPLKLVIAGNHDFTLDTPMFKKKVETLKASTSVDDKLIETEYGNFGEARQLFEAEEAKTAGIVFLDEGNHRFELANGAILNVYASPYTPSLSDWGFQYHPEQEHEWNIHQPADVIITHGPPKGVLDYTDGRQRAGSPSLFAAVARTKPRLHCFGHIHESWGAKKVAWRDELTDSPSHFTDIDNDESVVIQTLSSLKAKKFNSPEDVLEKEAIQKRYHDQGHCAATDLQLKSGQHTLFVNAAIEGSEEGKQQWAWLIDLDLPMAHMMDANRT